MDGSAELEFAVRDGLTRLVRSRTSPPITVQRALYLDDALPDMAYLHLMNPTAGVFEGDSIRLSVHVREGARAHLTSQAASRLHPMPAGVAHLSTSFDVEERGYFEYIPDPIIPYAGSQLVQRTEIAVHEGATVVYGDVLLAGRVAHGERYSFRRYESTLTIFDQSRIPLYHESYNLEPGRCRLHDIGVLGASDAGALVTFIVVTHPHCAGPVFAQLQRELGADGSQHVGVGTLRDGRGVAVKALSSDTREARHVVRSAWYAVRQTLLGVGVPPLWKR